MGRQVAITLTESQVELVLEEASEEEFNPIRAFADLRSALYGAVEPTETRDRHSESLLRALMVLRGSQPDRRITDVAYEIALPVSTAYRYADTWVAVGLLELVARSRLFPSTQEHPPLRPGAT